MLTSLHQSSLLFDLSIIPPLHLTIDMPFYRLIYPSFALSFSSYQFLQLPIILPINHTLPSNTGQSLHYSFHIYESTHSFRPCSLLKRFHTRQFCTPFSLFRAKSNRIYRDLNTRPSGLSPVLSSTENRMRLL
jgi:hypothetical protein